MAEQAIQDMYIDEFAHCYGCGRLNNDGLQIKSYLDGEETVCRFTPGHKHSGGLPGFLYGGMIASLMDCHAAATAWAAKARTEPEKTPLMRFVTASLKIDFRVPTPTNTEVEIRGKVNAIKRRKVVVDLTLSVGGNLCAEGSAVMCQIPSNTQEG